MSKVFIEAFAVGIVNQSGVRFENIPCRGRDALFKFAVPGGKKEIWVVERIASAQSSSGGDSGGGVPIRRTSRPSSVVHLERELDFTLVILTVAYRSDFPEVTCVEEIE